MMTTIYKHHQQFTSYTKGSIEEILQHCSHIIKNEKIIAINDSDIKEILKIANECSENALRVLGLAIRSNIQKNEFKNSETNMTFLGFCSMYDPPRDEVRAVIEKCNNAGVRIIMITGDHPKTALAIATYLKIAQKGERVISGKELLTMNFDDLMVAVKDCHVFARVSPTDKINIVKALKANNDVVAMTGDGVNDAPSLKMADIGIAMGINGTDVAKDAANLILLDDNFTTIGKAVEEGRRIYTNLQKVIMFLVTGNISEIFIILLFSMMIN
jgi:Ca2+-transporting ATPase